MVVVKRNQLGLLVKNGKETAVSPNLHPWWIHRSWRSSSLERKQSRFWVVGKIMMILSVFEDRLTLSVGCCQSTSFFYRFYNSAHINQNIDANKKSNVNCVDFQNINSELRGHLGNGALLHYKGILKLSCTILCLLLIFVFLTQWFV